MSKKKFRYALNLQTFSEDTGMGDPGVDNASAAEVQNPEPQASQTGVDSQAAAEPEKQNNFEKAFAKRLAAEREKWEQDVKTKYQGYEDYKTVAEYLQEANGGADLMTLKEQIELERLQARAEREQVPPEVLKRLDELEAKAAKADEFERRQAESQKLTEFESSLKTFCEGKEVDGKPVSHNELWQYMHENQIAKPEAALKAMKADILEAKLQERDQDVIKRYLESKQAPKVEGTGTAGAVNPAPPKSFEESRERALARLRAANQPT